MAVLYYATGGDDWVDDKDFLSNSSVCYWPQGDGGIGCDDSGTNIVNMRLGKLLSIK